jgi:hypothetical protein
VVGYPMILLFYRCQLAYVIIPKGSRVSSFGAASELHTKVEVYYIHTYIPTMLRSLLSR